MEGSYHLNQVAAFYGHTGPGGFPDITTWVQYQPVGVVGVISPWNFPMNVMCRKTLPALLTGNTVVFKPASFTPWSGIVMARLFERAGLPVGVFNCVTVSVRPSEAKPTTRESAPSRSPARPKWAKICSRGRT
jgi:acyl-CoA reductase-like NAD-dependent aldehyde dehydrogenase